jgi:hypothetical protein
MRLLGEKAHAPPGGTTRLSNARQGRQAATGLHRPIRHEIIRPICRVPAAGPRYRGPSAHRLCRSSGRPALWPASVADGHVIFGLLALQVGLIDQAQFVAALHAWTCDKARPQADHIRTLGHLDDEQRGLVEALAAQHLKKHDGDAEKNLAAFRGRAIDPMEPRRRRPTSKSPRHSPASSSTRTATPTPIAPPPTPSVALQAVASGSASSAPAPKADWARSSWRGTRSCTARRR